MVKKKEKGFTLIELIAVLVIMAIIALIVTPLVMSIIRKARVSADKRSIDAYGRSIELAIAGYLLDNGSFPTSIDQLTIEYSGDEVVCTTTNLNSDSSIYLAGCTVGGRSVEGYTYGKEEAGPTYTAYSVGDQVTYNNINYYVIKDSSTSEESVTMLKAEPLTTEEVNQYGSGHINRYTNQSQGTAYDRNGYGGMQYYSSSTCGYNGSSWVYSGCTTDYAQSEVKYVVDTWKNAKAPEASEARLITLNEVTDLGYEYFDNGSVQAYNKTESTPSWLYNENYRYWTSSPYNDSSSEVWVVNQVGHLDGFHAFVNTNTEYVVRPVITLSKSNLSS